MLPFHLKKLQRVQNSLARVVTKSTKFTSSGPLLDKLHWLPIVSRISFKIACLTYKAVHMNQPPLLSACLKLRPINVETRFSDNLQLQYPLVGNNNFGRRAFAFSAPTIWNQIPLNIRNAPSLFSFRKQLKTFYFRKPPKPPNC